MMKKLFSFNAVIILTTILLLVFEVHLLTNAQGAPAQDVPVAVTKSADINACVRRIQGFVVQQQIDFGHFINEHFQSDKPTSELVPVALERLRKYHEEVQREVNRFVNNDKEAPDALQRAACKKVADDDFVIM